MKTQQECWEALIAGKTLISCRANEIVKLSEGFVHDAAGKVIAFSNPYDWSIYEPPKPKVVRWLWAYDGSITTFFYTEKELGEHRVNSHVKLEWSRTEFNE